MTVPAHPVDREPELAALRRRVAALERMLQQRPAEPPAALPPGVPELGALLQSFLDSTPDWLFAKDLQHRFLFVNRSFATAQGLTPSAMVGRRDTGFWGIEQCEPGPDTGQQGFHADDRAAFAGETVHNPRLAVTIADGSIRVFDTVKSPLRAADDRILGVLCYCRDVTAEVAAETALRQSGEQLRAIVETEPECVKLLDGDGRVLEMNPAGLRMIEADSIEQVRGQGIGSIVDAADRPAFLQMLAAVFRGEARTLVFDVVGLHGTHRTLETHSVPMWSDSEPRVVRALLGVTRDITARLRAEQARRSLERQLRQSQKLQAMGTLARGIAHDFNNILTAIFGHAELLQLRTQVDANLQANVAGILTAAKRARDLVQQILTFSARREHERRTLLLQPLVHEALQMLRATLAANIIIDTRLACGTLRILAEATQVHQVVLNLCTNSAHAMREHGGVLLVACSEARVDEEFSRAHPGLFPGTYVCLSVTDNGHGMDPATLERIFEPFFTTKDPGEGTGLGLAVVHGIMQSHGGAVFARSRPGQGSTFDLYFPVAQDAVLAEAAAPAPSTAAVKGHGEHVLVVDDEPVLVDLARHMLTEQGYRVTGHHRPAEALAEFRQDPARFDLVLCDVVMPAITGLQFAAAVRAVRPDLAVLLVTGDGGRLDPDELERLGVSEVIAKPYQTSSLAEAVGRHLPMPD